MKIKTAVIIFILIAAGFTVREFLHGAEVRRMKVLIAESDSLQQETETAYSKLQEALEGKLKAKEVENQELLDIIASKDEKIREYQRIVFKQKKIIFEMENNKPGTVEEDTATGNISISFNGYKRPYTVAGKVWYPSGMWNLDIKRDPFSVECVVVQTRFGDIKKLYVSTDDSTLQVTDIKYRTIPEKTGLFGSLKFGGGVSYSKKEGPGLMLGAGAGKYMGGLTAHEGSIGGFLMKNF